MKKFSFLLIGAFLLGTFTFALAEKIKDANQLTGSVAEMPNPINTTLVATPETTTGNTTEVTTGDTIEATTGDTTEAETGDATETITGDTTEVTTGDTTEATTGDTTEATTGDTTEVTTGDTTEVTTGTTTEETNETSSKTTESTPTIPDSAKQTYDKEQIAAYEWAYKNGITTISDINEARLTDGLTRAELAKMMSQYMTNIQGKIPTIEKVEYADVDESLGDLADFIQAAYSYKIMGINADGTAIEEFNPNGLVTRADYATVFSRVLYGDKYNKSEGNYYEDHLIALKEAGILTNTTPTIQEIRGWVMLMMYRSTNPTTEETNEESTQIANPASEYCVAQGGTVNIVKDEEGNESGICKLADGTEVDEWEYFRENHKETETGATTEEPIEDTEGTGNTVSGPTLTITATPGKENN